MALVASVTVYIPCPFFSLPVSSLPHLTSSSSEDACMYLLHQGLAEGASGVLCSIFVLLSSECTSHSFYQVQKQNRGMWTVSVWENFFFSYDLPPILLLYCCLQQNFHWDKSSLPQRSNLWGIDSNGSR